MARRRRKIKRVNESPVVATIEKMSHEGRGITHVEDKVVFVDGSLEGETIRFQYTACHRNYDEAKTLEVIQASDDRVTPACDYFGICGGCSLQHMSSEQQIKMKQGVLMDLLERTSQINPERILPTISGSFYGYRNKARLGVRYVNKKQRLLIGFREKHSAFLADMQHCEVLDPRVGHQLHVLIDCISSLESYNQIAQIEVAITEEVVALVFRHLSPLSESDQQQLISLGQTFPCHIYLQSGGPETITLHYPDESRLTYWLPDFDIEIEFRPSDFTQVNASVNEKMISQAIQLLDLNENDQVLDLFCGVGNFSLPMARHAGSVVGVEGSADLVERAVSNAERNKILNAEFYQQDLAAEDLSEQWTSRSFDKVLIDPARPGALEILPLIAAKKPSHIVYVSCNPATLARDAGELVNNHGYQLKAAGVMDMFPHTAHVESMALFIKT